MIHIEDPTPYLTEEGAMISDIAKIEAVLQGKSRPYIYHVMKLLKALYSSEPESTPPGRR